MDLYSILCPLVFQFAFHVLVPIQSYSLKYLSIDDENPEKYPEVFDLEEYKSIQIYQNSQYIHTSKIEAIDENDRTTERIFSSFDYHTMINELVVIDTGNEERLVECHFNELDQARAYYNEIKPTRTVEKENFKLSWMKRLDCINQECQFGNCNREYCNQIALNVVEGATIFVENITDSDHSKYRFYVRKNNNNDIHMIFTSEQINITMIKKKARMMLSIKVNKTLYRCLVEFDNESVAEGFYNYVEKINADDPSISIFIPNIWSKLLESKD